MRAEGGIHQIATSHAAPCGPTTGTGQGQGMCVEEQSGAQRRSETHTPCPGTGAEQEPTGLMPLESAIV